MRYLGKPIGVFAPLLVITTNVPFFFFFFCVNTKKILLKAVICNFFLKRNFLWDNQG